MANIHYINIYLINIVYKIVDKFFKYVQNISILLTNCVVLLYIFIKLNK